MWGTIGSVLTPGLTPGVQFSASPVLSGFRTGFPVRACFAVAVLWLTQATAHTAQYTTGCKSNISMFVLVLTVVIVQLWPEPAISMIKDEKEEV